MEMNWGSAWNGVRNASVASRAMAGGALVCMTALGIVGSSEAFFSNRSVGEPSDVVRSPDPDTIFDGRSPGSRRYGWLVQSKAKRARFGDVPSDESPTERVLSSVRQRPGTVFESAPTDASYAAVYPVIGDEHIGSGGAGDASLTDPGPEPLAMGGSTVGGVPLGVVSSGRGTGGNVSGGGGGGGGSPDIVTRDIDLTFPVPVVPEPATWAMLVLGFFCIGAIMRGRRGSLLQYGTR